MIEQLLNRRARLPQYAGIKIQCVQVLIEVDEAGAPRGVVRVIPYHLTLDDDGYEDVQASVDAAGYIWNNSWEEAEESDVVDLQKHKERREQEKLYAGRSLRLRCRRSPKPRWACPKAPPFINAPSASRRS